jgi:hypothetical protein
MDFGAGISVRHYETAVAWYVRHATFRDPEGNEVSYGGAPLE